MASLEDVHPRVASVLKDVEARVIRHADFPGEIRNAADFARAADVSLDQVVKTLIAARREWSRQDRLAAPASAYVAATLPVASRLDTRGLAARLGWRGCEMASAQELTTVTGYPSLGVSPLGLALRIVCDGSLRTLPGVFVGSGAVGVEIEIEVDTLLDLTKAEIMPVAVARCDLE